MNVTERSFRKLVVCDIDNTLLIDSTLQEDFQGEDDRESLALLRQQLNRNPNVVFAVASGRSLEQIQDLMARYREFPVPDFLITSVGSQIYWRDGNTYLTDVAFQYSLRRGWNRTAMAVKLERFRFLEMQEPERQTPLKLSYYTLEGFDLAEVEKALGGVPCSIIYSRDRFLDILPEGASKAKAINFLRKILGLPKKSVATAGDSGNDHDMLEEFKGIVVANHQPELETLRDCPDVFFAQRPLAAGVLEGLQHYSFLRCK